VVQTEDKVLTISGVSSFPIFPALKVFFSLLFPRLAALSFTHSFQVWPSLQAVG